MDLITAGVLLAGIGAVGSIVCACYAAMDFHRGDDPPFNKG